MTEIVLGKHVTWEIGGPVSRSLAYWSFITWALLSLLRAVTSDALFGLFLA